MLRQRVITAVLLFLAVVGVLALGGADAWALLMLPVMVLAIVEWLRLLQRAPWLPLLGALAGAAAYWWLRAGVGAPPGWLAPVMALGLLAWLLMACASVFRVQPLGTNPWLPAVSMLALWISLYELRIAGASVLLSAMALVWLADIGAYFTGRAFGRRKLAPRVSPGKSWEGVWGGIALCIVTALVFRGAAGSLPDDFVVFSTVLAQHTGGPVMGLVLAAVVLLSVLGDLYESLLKRHAGVKDSGRCLPGHGGMFDRIDGLIPAMPLCLLIWMSLA
ncbi:MAG: phosphatidate cytidylyltransferase [Lautropia sp.]|nr:phosphatidate cytidylyltransferase [Lautropia sp.]